jgi:phosphoheptose isomerase
MLKNCLNAHIETAKKMQNLLPLIQEAGELATNTLKNGGKVLICGNGGSAADSQHIAAELSGRFKKERVALAGIALTTDTSALTAIGNDYGYEYVFSRQTEALANEGDLLIGISTSGVPIATLVASELNKDLTIYIPKKHISDEGKKITGSISQNFSAVNYKRAVVADDVVTSGSTLKECIKQLKEICSPKLIVVLIDKSGLDEIEGVPLIPLIRIGVVNVEEK